MLKKTIKNIISKLKENESITFYSNDNGWRQDTIEKVSIDTFSHYAQGQCWSDQSHDIVDINQAVRWVWSVKPHECY